MPEAKETRPVGAVLYPTKGLFEKAKAAGELYKLLGVKPGEGARSVCLRGQFIRKRLAGFVTLGERFFDWEKSESSAFAAELGRMKPQKEIEEIVSAGHPCRAEILLDADAYRKALGKGGA